MKSIIPFLIMLAISGICQGEPVTLYEVELRNRNGETQHLVYEITREQAIALKEHAFFEPLPTDGGKIFDMAVNYVDKKYGLENPLERYHIITQECKRTELKELEKTLTFHVVSFSKTHDPSQFGEQVVILFDYTQVEPRIVEKAKPAEGGATDTPPVAQPTAPAE